MYINYASQYYTDKNANTMEELNSLLKIEKDYLFSRMFQYYNWVPLR